MQLDLLETTGHATGFVVRESARARRMSIKVTAHRGVEVVVPRRTRADEVRRFVSAHRDWIERTRREVAAQAPPVDTSPPAAIHLPALDAHYDVRYLPLNDTGRRPGVRLDGTILTVRGPRSDSAVTDLLVRWLRVTARRHLEPWLAGVAGQLGMNYARVQIRAQRTRWGSCSSSGTISLNFCLLFLPPDDVRYLMIHELCHTRHMNHSRRFWSLVARHAPDYRRCEQRLDQAWRAIPGWVGIF